MNVVNKKTQIIWEDAGMKMETDKESASLDRPSEKSIPDFSETAPRPLRLGDSALKVLPSEDVSFKQTLPCLKGHKGLRSSPMSETDTFCSSRINYQSLSSHKVKSFLPPHYRTRGLSLLSNFIINGPSNVPGTAWESLLIL